MTYNELASKAYLMDIEELDADVKRREAELKLLKGIRSDRSRNGEKTKAQIKAAETRKAKKKTVKQETVKQPLKTEVKPVRTEPKTEPKHTVQPKKSGMDFSGFDEALERRMREKEQELQAKKN